MSQPADSNNLARTLRAGSLAAFLALIASTTILGLITHPILVDGDVAEWGDVLTDPDNVAPDAASFSDPPDPDMPGTADRDLRGAAFTWDDQNLYFFFRRTLSGNSSFDFIVYIDLGHDGFLDDGDVLVAYSYSGDAFQGAEIHDYLPLDPAGDPVVGDGEDEPGQAGDVRPGSPTAASSPDGIEFEASVPWADLGLAPGSCLNLHVSIGRGLNLPGQIEDNLRVLDTQDVAPRLEAPRTASVASPGVVHHAHRVCNDGNCDDVYDLTVVSAEGWRVELWSDPDGDGDPADGSLLGIDVSGDGDFVDTEEGDFVDPSADANGNDFPDAGMLPPDECYDFVVVVSVPPGVATGTEDRERLRARPEARVSRFQANDDHVNVGPVVLFPDREATAMVGDEGWIPHQTCNHQSFTDTLDLAASSLLGWSLEIWSDPNGDGNPSDGSPVSDTGPLAADECFDLLVHAFVPAGETPGAVDEITATASSRTDPLISESALDLVTVFASGHDITPDHDRDSGPGDVLFMSHVLRNHRSAEDSYALTAVSDQPTYEVRILTDPNGDGRPDDSEELPQGAIVGPLTRNGGEYRFLIRVDVPNDRPIGEIATVTVAGESQVFGVSAAALDTIDIGRIRTYSDPMFARPVKVFFTSCAKAFTQAYGLEVNRRYRIVWTDPLGVEQRISPSYLPDALGRVDDSYGLPCDVVPGLWTLRLEQRAGNQWIPLADGETTFTTLDEAAGEAGDILRLRTDRDVYNVVDAVVSVESTLDNDTEADYVESVIEYVLFMDDDGDGRPTDGEPWIAPDGSRGSWAAGDLTHETLGVMMLSGQQYEDWWQVRDVQFETEGQWCVHELWLQECENASCGREPIDEALQCFLVDCIPFPEVEAGGDKTSCAGDPVALDDATSDGDEHLWDDGGVGGSFSPSADVLNPTWTPPGPGSYTLTLTSNFTESGCDAFDTLAVTVDERPLAEAGADRTTCAGDAVALDDAGGGIADSFSWDDGGAGGLFSPSSTALNPSYTPPDPAPATITLTLTATVTATGCADSDSLLMSVDPNPEVDAGADETTCAGDGIALDDASGGAADSFAWDDGGAGGVFSPSAAVLNPSYAPADPAPASLTLTLTATVTATGCDSVDTLNLSVDPNPEVDAGADETTCAGDSLALDDATGGAADSFAWDDGGAGGVFSPSATVLNPSYTPADPAPASLTLTLTATVSATGCDSVDTLGLSVDPNPVIDAGVDETTCAGDSLALDDATGGAADSFAWDDGGAGGLFSPSATVLNPSYTPADPAPAGVTLTLTATVSSTGCDSVDALELVVDPNPVTDAGADETTCAGDSLALDDATGGAADSFAWDDGGAGGVFSPSSTVLNPSYTPADPAPARLTLTLLATVSSTGCDSVDALELFVDPNPEIDAGADKTACAGDALDLGDATGGAADDFAWDDGGTGGLFSPSATVLNPSYTPADPAPGSVTLTLTATVSATGCDSLDTLTLSVDPNPVIDAGVDKTTCAGDSLALDDASGGAADSFAWDDGGAGGLFSPSSSVLNPSYTPADPAPASLTLTLTATVSATGCDSVDTLSLSVDPNPVIDAGATKTICAGDSLALDDALGGAADSFAWDDGGAGGLFSPSAAVLNPDYIPADPAPADVTLTLVATVTATGCDSLDTLTLSVDPNPVIDAGADKVSCAGDPVALADALGGSADGFAWGDGGAGGLFSPSATVLNPSYTPADPAPPTLTLTLIATVAATGCDSVDILTVTVDPNPVVEAGADKTTCAGDAIPLDDATGGASDGFLWDDGGAGGVFSPSATVLNPSYTPADPAPASIVLTLAGTTASGGCDSVDTLNLTVDPNPIVVAGPDQTTCAGDAIALDDAVGGVADVFAWDDGGAGGAFSPSAFALNPSYTPADPAPAVVTLTLTATISATGCDSVNALALSVSPNPVIAAGADRAACFGDAILLDDAIGGAADGFLWDDGGAGGSFLPSATVLNPSYEPANPGPVELNLTATITATGCDSVDSLALIVSERPVAEAGADGVFTCAAPEAMLDGSATGGDDSAGRSFRWEPAADVADADAATTSTTVAGTYTLTVTDLATGCFSSDTVVIVADDVPPLAEAGPARVLTCAVTEVVLAGVASGGNGSAGHDYSWEPAGDVSDAAAAQPTTQVPGTFTLTVTDRATGCRASDLVVVTSDTAEPVAMASSSGQLACDVLTVELSVEVSGGNGSEGHSYAWEPAAAVSDPTAANPEVSTPGLYSVTVTDNATGCSAISLVEVTYVTDPAPAEPSLGGRPPLLVAWDDPQAQAELVVTWEELPAAEQRLHRGTLAALWSSGYDHAPLACGLVAATHAFGPTDGSAYYLAAAVSCDGLESPLGDDSRGRPRPDTATASGLTCP